jgi:hypothetical protein
MSANSSRPPGLSLVVLLAVSAGATVANLYYSQPILAEISWLESDFDFFHDVFDATR